MTSQASGRLGLQGVVELTGIVGYYTLISMTINAFLVPVPDGADNPFAGLGGLKIDAAI